MKFFRIVSAALIALLLIPALALAEPAYVVAGTKIFAEPDKDSKSAEIPAGTKLSLVATKGGWAKVKKGDAVGYMDASKLATVVDQGGKTVYAEREISVYKAPSSSGKSRSVAQGTKMSLLATAGDWAYVKAGSAKGFVKADGLTASAPEKVAEETVRGYARRDGVKVYESYKGSSAVLATLSANDAVHVSAAKGDWCQVVNGDSVGYVKVDDLSKSKVDAPEKESGGSSPGYSSAKAADGSAREMDWWDSDIRQIFSRGTTATVTDVATGISWRVKRSGGTNHADVQPLTAADTASMRKACGGWSWDRRAIFVTIDGVNYAASMNCMPHGSGNITDNDFDGHHCIHFTNSRTHGGNRICPLHQAAIKKAASVSL